MRFFVFWVLWQLRVCTKVLSVEAPQLNDRLASTRAAMISRYTSVHTVVRLLACSVLVWTIVCGTVWADPPDNGVVRGVVWSGDNSPIGNAKVRLRNLETGRVVAASETSDNGQFIFGGVARGSYLVELVSDNGKVLAVGPAFRIEPEQTVSTVVRLPTRRSWYAGMFSNAAAAVIAAASSVGLTAVGSHGPPISPQ
jgi:hypothetical protein